MLWEEVDSIDVVKATDVPMTKYVLLSKADEQKFRKAMVVNVKLVF